MQIIQILNKRCFPNTEIEYFLRIQELTQAIILANERMKTAEDDDAQWLLQECINRGELAKHSNIYCIAQFGIFHPKEYDQWYAWWKNYFNSLNEIEIGEIEKAFINGEDISEWRPEGTWRKK